MNLILYSGMHWPCIYLCSDSETQQSQGADIEFLDSIYILHACIHSLDVRTLVSYPLEQARHNDCSHLLQYNYVLLIQGGEWAKCVRLGTGNKFAC